MNATILFWRHGQTDYNAQRRLQGQVDIPLNTTGVDQAAAAAPVLAQVRPAAIISSDLLRARDTAMELGALTGVRVGTDERLRERNFGAWEGLNHEEMRAGWPEAFASWRDGGHPQDIGAESRSALGQRVAQAATDASGAYGAGEVVVLVSHGAAISAGIVTLLGEDAEHWHGVTGIGNCHWSVLRPNDSAIPPWRLTAHNAGGTLTDFPQGARIV